MTKEEKDFIIEALGEAIGWAEYAGDYFQQKHDLNTDKDNVEKSIRLLKESRNCYNCNKYINHGFGWIECNVIPKSACVDIDYCSEWQQK